jgi:hypothetical protein
MQRPVRSPARSRILSVRIVVAAVVTALFLTTGAASATVVDDGWCDVFPQWPGCTN